MSTRSSVFYGTDEGTGQTIHVYWEHIDQKHYIDVEDVDDGEEIECPPRLLRALGITEPDKVKL